MKPSRRFLTAVMLALALAGTGLLSQAPRQTAAPQTDEAKILEAMHLIQSQPLYNYVAELVSEKYGGRLTGTKDYEACVEWVESLLKGWGIEPGGENGTYRQLFPNPYTIVLPGGVCEMLVPAGKGGVVKKSYRYEDEFIPGGTSGSGEVTAEVVYVGYGITAPELGYDDYKGVDVKGKIVLLESRGPGRPGREDARALQEVAALFLPSVQAQERRGPRSGGDDLQLRAHRQPQQRLRRGLRLPSRRRRPSSRTSSPGRAGSTRTSWPPSARTSSRSPSPRARR